MLTDLTKAIFEKDPELKKTWVDKTPMDRMGNPEDLAVRVPHLGLAPSADA